MPTQTDTRLERIERRLAALGAKLDRLMALHAAASLVDEEPVGALRDEIESVQDARREGGR